MLLVWPGFPSPVRYYPIIAAQTCRMCGIENTHRYVLFPHGVLIRKLLAMEYNYYNLSIEGFKWNF